MGDDNEFRLSASDIANLDKMIDCKANAAEWISTRSVDPDWTELVSAAGFDPEKTITEIDNNDYGDANGWYDTAQVHTIRYMPLKYLKPEDISLLLNYDPEASPIVPIACALLEQNPLEDADLFDGHLLSRTADAVSGTINRMGSQTPPSFLRAETQLKELVPKAYNLIFDEMRTRAKERGDDAEPSIRKFQAGNLKINETAFRDFADVLNEIGSAHHALEAQTPLSVAVVDMFFQYSAKDRDYAMVRIATPDDHTAEDWDQDGVDYPDIVRRVTLTLTEDPGGGVRVRAEANPSTVYNDPNGEHFPSANEARQAYTDRYGMPEAHWKTSGAWAGKIRDVYSHLISKLRN